MSKAQVREEKDYSNKVIDADSLLFLADKLLSKPPTNY